MKQKASHAKIRFILGTVSLVVGLLAANLALFNWVERTGLHHLLGEYARYMCAYGGFGAMIFGSMLVTDFLTNRRRISAKENLSDFMVNWNAAKEKKAVVRKARK